MASGNHVEELESRVRELEATVDGLTDELVECKVRIRELEDVIDAEIGLDNIDSVTGSDTGADESQTNSADDGDTASGVQVADESTPGPEAAEASKSEGSEEADKTEADEGDSDIIIA